jgi:hypothetical protein
MEKAQRVFTSGWDSWEATLAALAARRVRTDLPNCHVMVVTPFWEQMRIIRSFLRDMEPPIPVRTIAKCQGEQAEYVILSLTGWSKGFFLELRAQITALSRAMFGYYILADRSRSLAGPPTDRQTDQEVQQNCMGPSNLHATLTG